METQVITTEKMEALKALADANVKVSEVKGVIAQLKVEESAYLESREKKALKQIQKILEESESVLKEALSNYEAIHQFAKDTSQLADFVKEAYGDFKKLQVTFNDYTAAWESDIKAKESTLSDLQKKIKVDKIQIENDREAVRAAEKRVAVDRIKIRDERGTLERAIARLKDNRI